MRWLTLLRIRGLGCLHLTLKQQQKIRISQPEIKRGCPGSCQSSSTSGTQWAEKSQRKDTDDEPSPCCAPAHTWRNSLPIFSSQHCTPECWRHQHFHFWGRNVNQRQFEMYRRQNKRWGKGSKRGTPQRGSKMCEQTSDGWKLLKNGNY